MAGLSDPGALGIERPPATQSGLGRQAGVFCHSDRLVCGGGQTLGQSGLPGGRLDDPGIGATTRCQGRSPNRGAAQKSSAGKISRPRSDAAGGADGGRVSSAISRARRGRQKTMETRVEWHEAKLGVYYRHEQAVAGERGQLLEKVLVGWQGEGLELAVVCIGRRCAADWGGRGKCWPWPTARPGFGTSWQTVGAGRISCWTFIAFNNNIGMLCRQKGLGWRRWAGLGGVGF